MKFGQTAETISAKEINDLRDKIRIFLEGTTMRISAQQAAHVPQEAESQEEVEVYNALESNVFYRTLLEIMLGKILNLCAIEADPKNGQVFHLDRGMIRITELKPEEKYISLKSLRQFIEGNDLEIYKILFNGYAL